MCVTELVVKLYTFAKYSSNTSVFKSSQYRHNSKNKNAKRSIVKISYLMISKPIWIPKNKETILKKYIKSLKKKIKD